MRSRYGALLVADGHSDSCRRGVLVGLIVPIFTFRVQRQNAVIKAELARTELVHLLIVTDQERCRGASASDGCLADFQVVGQAAKG